MFVYVCGSGLLNSYQLTYNRVTVFWGIKLWLEQILVPIRAHAPGSIIAMQHLEQTCLELVNL